MGCFLELIRNDLVSLHPRTIKILKRAIGIDLNTQDWAGWTIITISIKAESGSLQDVKILSITCNWHLLSIHRQSIRRNLQPWTIRGYTGHACGKVRTGSSGNRNSSCVIHGNQSSSFNHTFTTFVSPCRTGRVSSRSHRCSKLKNKTCRRYAVIGSSYSITDTW